MVRLRVIIDIETIGCNWSTFSDKERAYLIEHARGDDPAAKEQAAREQLALSALTGEVVLVGMLNPDTGKGRIHLRSPDFVEDRVDGEPSPSVLNSLSVLGVIDDVKAALSAAGFDEISIIHYETERGLLISCWRDLADYDQVISFNGREFDGPFLMQRSLAHSVEISRDLVPNRYGDQHVDLADRLSCYGVVRERRSLDFWCRRLGIESPKEGMRGGDVERLWRAGNLAELCRYNAGDLRATALLFERYVAAFGRIHGIAPFARVV